MIILDNNTKNHITTVNLKSLSFIINIAFDDDNYETTIKDITSVIINKDGLPCSNTEPSLVFETVSIWCANGEIHRDTGPAIEHTNGTKEWWSRNIRHRVSGPAIEHFCGRKEWYLNGFRHRTDGPAVESPTGTIEWWVNGMLHHMDGPAMEYFNGSKLWYQNGLLHRDGGPSIEWADGSKEWYLNGKRHRLDGPAKTHINQSLNYLSREWWIDGQEIYVDREPDPEEWRRLVLEYKLKNL
jgi:hypothetical protein